jgi:type IV pilus assembly protein PilM
LIAPRAAGIDISDSSVKWLSLIPAGEYLHIDSYGELPLESGIVENGVIRDAHALAEVLGEVKGHLKGVRAAHAALPEEPAYVFGMTVPHSNSRTQTLRMIEFEFEGRVPIPPSAAVYDFSRIHAPSRTENDEIGVVVFPKDLAEAYAEVFDLAGISLLSLEVEARSIGRAVSARVVDEPITLLVDFGRARTGFAVLKRGIPIFTSTVDVGGDTVERALMEKMHMTESEAEHFKNEKGLLAESGQKSPELEAVSGTASALVDEIARHFHYWDTRRNERGERVTPVGKVLLVGGNANLKGLPDYIAGRVKAPTERGQVWQHVAPFDTYIPPIESRSALQYATAIGLALRSF